jgi:Tfp pilus assembly protein PilO
MKLGELQQQLKTLVIPLVGLVVLIFLSIMASKLVVGRIDFIRQQTASLQNTVSALEDKLSVLQDLGSEIPSLRNELATLMPSRNSALFAYSQVKSLANFFQVNLDNFKVGQEVVAVSKKLEHVEISFDVEGSLAQIENFLTELGKSAPLTKINKARITQSGGLSRASIELFCFWASYPTKLPDISEPIKELSQEERDLLSLLSSFKPPLLEELVPNKPASRSNPFTSQ